MLTFQSLVFGSLICLIALYLKYRWSRRRLYELAEKIPGPKGLPLIGIGHMFLIPNYQKIFQILADIAKEFTSPVKAWLGPELLFVADTPEALQIVLNSEHCLDKSPLYDAFLATKGLVIANGQLWRHHRKILNPAFSVRAVQQLIPTFDEKAKIFAESLKAEVDRKPFDVLTYVAACSLETILKGTMEVNRDIQRDPHSNQIIEDVEVGSRIMMIKVLNVFYRFKPYYWCSKLYKLEKKHIINGIFKLADDVLDERRTRENELAMHATSEDNDGYTKKAPSFIAALTDPSNGLSREEKFDEINTIIAAGHETSALVISHTLLMLALHPDVQQTVFRELGKVFGLSDAEINYNSLSKLVYLDMVLREVMRLFPVLPLSARRTNGEFEIGEYTIPAGATILISTYQIHRDPKYWGDDAHLFKPERFEPESFKKIPPYAYIPFTGGPRICIGWRYGMMFMKTVLVNLLQKFEVDSPLKYEELEYEITLSMKVVQRCMITLKARNEISCD